MSNGIRELPGPAGRLEALLDEPDGAPRAFRGDEVASMNLWGFAPAMLPVLTEQFAAFLDASGADPGAEFPLSTAVNAQVAQGRGRWRVLVAPDHWFGMTFAADLPAVRDALAALVRDGTYPADLRAAFDRL